MSHAGNDELKEQVFEEGVIEPCVVCSMPVVFESSKENDYEEYEVEEETGDKYCFQCYVAEFDMESRERLSYQDKKNRKRLYF